MKVIDLPVEQEKLYCTCLEEWSDEMREAGNHKEQWLQRMNVDTARKLTLSPLGN